MASPEKLRAMSESRVFDLTLLLQPLGLDPVGLGSFGDVYKYKLKDGRLCAVKSLRFLSDDHEKKIALARVRIQNLSTPLLPQVIMIHRQYLVRLKTGRISRIQTFFQ